jgi:hypothetical protein
VIHLLRDTMDREEAVSYVEGRYDRKPDSEGKLRCGPLPAGKWGVYVRATYAIPGSEEKAKVKRGSQVEVGETGTVPLDLRFTTDEIEAGRKR